MKKTGLTFLILFMVTGCAEHRYYHRYHHHSPEYYHRRHMPPPAGVNMSIHLHNAY